MAYDDYFDAVGEEVLTPGVAPKTQEGRERAMRAEIAAKAAGGHFRRGADYLSARDQSPAPATEKVAEKMSATFAPKEAGRPAVEASAPMASAPASERVAPGGGHKEESTLFSTRNVLIGAGVLGALAWFFLRRK